MGRRLVLLDLGADAEVIEMTPETKLKNSIRKYLDSLGRDLWHFKVHGSGYQKAGVPDNVGCYLGHFFAIEAKAPGEVTTKKQDRELMLIRQAGGFTRVVWSLKEAQDFMEEIKNVDQGCPG
jgi:hypothetical protein